MGLQLLSIDPGFRYFGYALFDSQGSLFEASLKKSKSGDWDKWTNQPPDFSLLADIILKNEWDEREAVVEFPQIYTSTPNPGDILKLGSACGAYTALLQASGFNVQWVLPKEWKGTVPKEIMVKRILAKIREEEYNNISNPKDHNIIDAIGIGLWKIKRNNQ